MFLILSLCVFGLLVARLMSAPPGSWRYIVGAGIVATLASQLLPAAHPLRVDLAGSARDLGWLALVAAPFAVYGLVIRQLRKRTGADRLRADLHPAGLVVIPQDTALAIDTETALTADARRDLGTEAVDAPISLAWRDGTGALVGHLRLQRVGDTAEILALRVAAPARGQGIGTGLIRGAIDEAVAAGAHRLGVRVADRQEAARRVLAAAGFEVAGRIGDAGAGWVWMERGLR